MTVLHALEIAINHHQMGRLGEAEVIYRRILAAEPHQPDALHLLGVLCSQAGRPADAVKLITAALQIKPTAPEFHINLGNACRESSMREDAVAAYQRAIELRPDSAEAHHNLGDVLAELEQWSEAEKAYRAAIQLHPGLADAYEHLAKLLARQGRHDEAVALLELQTQRMPTRFTAWVSLATALRDAGDLQRAIAAYESALSLRPDHTQTLNNLGNALWAAGAIARAESAYHRGIATDPQYAPLHANLGNLYTSVGRLDKAVPSHRQASRLSSDLPSSHSNLLVTLQYCAGQTLGSLLEAHREFDQRYAAPLREDRPHQVTREADRPLRVGIISPHFALHPVGSFLSGVLPHLERQQLCVIAYSDTCEADAMTTRLRAATAEWHDARTLSDARLAERIRADRIDILIDLAGHTAGNRLLAFARKPAPIQITWLDYVGTTGLSAIDYIIGDRHEIPPRAEFGYQEKVLRMPDGYVCYEPPADAPAVSPLPALRAGAVTFASFNIPAKTTTATVQLWARVLREVPGSRLLLKNRAFDEPSCRARFEQLFLREGIPPGRIHFHGWSPRAEVLALYSEVDIALDTLPYNGGITTCEALWMGVPVVTCPGETFASRHGLTHLSTIGLTSTIAADEDEYIAIAKRLSGDLPALATLRASLRGQMAGSPLCDGPRFAAAFTALLRGTWREWLDR